MHFYTVNICFRLFYFSGINPEEGYTRSQMALFISSLFYSSLLIFLVVFQFNDNDKVFTFNDISDAASCVLLMVHCMAKSTPMFIFKNDVMQLLNGIDKNFWTLEDIQKAKSRAIYIILHRRLENKCNLLLIFYIGTLFAYFLGPLFSEGEVLIYECYRPTWMPYYCLMILMDLIGTLSTLLVLIPVDIFFMTLATLAQIQFKLLNEELEDLFETYVSVDVANIREKLKKCILHHSFMLIFVKRMNYIFSQILLPFFGIILITMCLEMYRASSQTDFKRFIESMMYISSGLYEFMFCYCLPAQALMDEASQVGERIYLSEWYKQEEFSKSLLMIIPISQRDIIITAGGVVNIDVKTGLATIKSMISYCMFLRTMATDR